MSGGGPGCSCSGTIKISDERSREMRKAETLTQKIRNLGGLSIQNRTYHLRSYYSCFVGEIVNMHLLVVCQCTNNE
jgi:hypothetical protein